MTLPKRFALSTMLLLMLLVAAVFGYAQWRKQWLAMQIEELQSAGVTEIYLSDDWFWPNVSSSAQVVFFRNDDGSLELMGKSVSYDSAREHYNSLRAQLHSIGVSDVSCAAWNMRSHPARQEALKFNEPEK